MRTTIPRCHGGNLEATCSGRDLYEGTDQTARQARALNAVGWYLTQLGDHRATLEHCRGALALLEEVGDRSGQASALDVPRYAVAP